MQQVYNEAERQYIRELGLTSTLNKIDKIIEENKYLNAVEVQKGYIEKVKLAVDYRRNHLNGVKKFTWDDLKSKWIYYDSKLNPSVGRATKEDLCQELIGVVFALMNRNKIMKGAEDWLTQADYKWTSMGLESSFEDKEAYWYDLAEYVVNYYQNKNVKSFKFKDILTEKWLTNYEIKTLCYFVLHHKYYEDLEIRRARIKAIANKLNIDLV